MLSDSRHGPSSHVPRPSDRTGEGEGRKRHSRSVAGSVRGWGFFPARCYAYALASPYSNRARENQTSALAKAAPAREGRWRGSNGSKGRCCSRRWAKRRGMGRLRVDRIEDNRREGAKSATLSSGRYAYRNSWLPLCMCCPNCHSHSHPVESAPPHRRTKNIVICCALQTAMTIGSLQRGGPPPPTSEKW